MRAIISLLLAVLLAGCTTGPRFRFGQVHPMSAATRLEIERTAAEMKEAARSIVFEPTN